GDRQGRPVFCLPVVLSLCFVVWLLPGPLAAEDSVRQDLRYTLLARETLLADKELAPLDLGVRVRNRVVTLWGPVPSAALARRAVARLARLPEFSEVRNELCVDLDGRLAPSAPRPPEPYAPPQPVPPANPRPAVRSEGVLPK